MIHFLAFGAMIALCFAIVPYLMACSTEALVKTMEERKPKR